MGFLDAVADARTSLTNSINDMTKSGGRTPGATGKKMGLGAGVSNVPLPGSSAGAGYLGPWGEDRLTNIAIMTRTGQVLMAFILLIIAIVLASFQSKWIGKLSGLTAILLVASALTLLVTGFMLGLSFLPHVLQDRGERFIALLEQPRLALVMNGAGTAVWLLLALTQVISAYSMPGCKDPQKDPHANSSTGKKDDYVKALPSFCTSKKAGAAVCWILFLLCIAMLLVFLHSWRLSRKNGPRIPPFVHPDDGAFEPLGDDLDGDADNLYDQDKPVTGHAAEATTGPVPPAARYGEGGDGRYGDPQYASHDYHYNKAQAYDADPRIARAYGLDPHDMRAPQHADSRKPSHPSANPFSDAAAMPRQSYDYGAYSSGAPTQTVPHDPYAAMQQHLRNDRVPSMPPSYRG